MKFFVLPLMICFLFPVFLGAAPGSVYGKALQRARNVAGQAERSRALPPEKPRTLPPEKKRQAAVNRFNQMQDFSRTVSRKKMKSYPVSGVAGINEMLARKVITPEQIGVSKQRITEKDLSFAWFGSEANQAKEKDVFPLFITKPSKGEVIVGYTDGKVQKLKNRPRTVTGVIHVLRSGAKNKKSSLWNAYLKTAGSIDKASK